MISSRPELTSFSHSLYGERAFLSPAFGRGLIHRYVVAAHRGLNANTSM